MKYVPKNFVNGQSPPINAQALNDIENALVALCAANTEKTTCSSGSNSILYVVDFENFETKPDADDLPLMAIITPTVTNDENLFIKTNWQDDSYPVIDMSTNENVATGVIKANQPTILLFDGERFWVNGSGGYLKYGVFSNLDGFWDHSDTAPTGTKRINYSGILHATELHGAVYNNIGADVAEGYPVEGKCEPGDLVSVDENGKYKRNIIANNTRTIGFYSEEYAALYGTEYGNYPIAIAGRLHVKVIGPCVPGDYLTASSVPGAVSAVDVQSAIKGSIVAMALEGCDASVADVNYVLAQIVRM